MANSENINISGMGTITGGEFNKVNISGMGTVSGDLKALDVQVAGNSVFKGNFVSGALSLSGRAVFEKDVAVEKAEISGSFECKGNLNAKTASVSGRISVGGLLKCDQTILYGYLIANRGLEAEEFVAKGSFLIDGLLNSGVVDISIGGFCQAKEIGCEKITVKIGKMSNTFSQIIQFFYSAISQKNIKNNKLVADSIEGNDINLEYTEAAIVRGKIVRIGQGCKIGRIEYSDSLSIDSDAKVTESFRI